MNTLAKPGRPLRILCLHGFRQSEGTFRAKTGALRKALKGYAELTYVQAPHELAVDDNVSTGSTSSTTSAGDGSSSAPPPGQYSWWDATADGKEYRLWPESLSYLEGVMMAQGPFDGILGFSQGAIAASILCALRHKAEVAKQPHPWTFRFAILVSGFPARSSEVSSLFEQCGTIALPSMHVIGRNDRLVKAEWSEMLVAMFHDPFVLTHDGGHIVPCNALVNPEYIEFIMQFAQTDQDQAATAAESGAGSE